jgi:RNA polymerase sigma factor (sigma-70 family)
MSAVLVRMAESVELSLDEAFRAYGDRLVRRLALVVADADEAQDLAQQTFVRAAERWPLADGRDVYRWLVVVGVRLALNERRRRRTWGLQAVRDEDVVWAMNTEPDLWLALRALEPKVRAALVLTTLDGYTQEEVARALGVRRGTVASWLSRARTRIRPILEERLP